LRDRLGDDQNAQNLGKCKDRRIAPAAFPLGECKAKYKMFFGVQDLSPPLNYFAPSTGGAYQALVTTELRVNF